MKTKINQLLEAGSCKNNLLAHQFLQSQEGMPAEKSIEYIMNYYLDNHEEGSNEILVDFGDDKCQIIFKLVEFPLYNNCDTDTYFSFTILQDNMTIDHRDFLIEEGEKWGQIGEYKKQDFVSHLNLDEVCKGCAKRAAKMIGNQAPKLD
jgi:hypothetical protein